MHICLPQAWAQIISRDIQGLSLPSGLWSNAGHIHSFSPVSPGFICVPVIQPPGRAVFQHTALLLASQQGLLWASRDHHSVVHHPPMSHLLHTSEFQLAPACQATCFLRDKTTFTVNLKDNLCSLCGISLTYYSIWWKIRNIWLQILSTADIRMCYYCANTGKEELESKRCQCGLRQHQASFKNHCALKIRAQMYTACTCTVHALFKFCSCTIRALLFV